MIFKILLIVFLIQTTTYQPQSDSMIWIEGKTNVNSFACNSDSIRGYAELRGDAETIMEALLPIDSLDCGKRQINRDMFKTLNADVYPNIYFEMMQSYMLGTSVDKGDIYLIRVEGELTISGQTRYVVFEAEGLQLENGKYIIRGHTPILMSDYGLTPPSAMLGMIKVDDELVVHFDLVGGLTQN